MLWNLFYSERPAVLQGLEILPPSYRLMFAASICERFLPNYNAFIKENGFGNYSILRNALDEVWKVIEGKPLNPQIINQLIKDCEALPPDEDYEETYKYEASMTIAAVCHVLEACLETTSQNIAELAYMAEEIVAETIEVERDILNPEREDMTFDEMEEDASNHRFWITESTKQNNDFQLLIQHSRQYGNLEQNFIDYFRKSSVDNVKSLIDLC